MSSSATAGKGTIFSRGNGEMSETFTPIAEVLSITGPGMKAETIDVTNMDSGGWREFITSLKDAGEVTFGLNFLPGNATHLHLIQDEIDTLVRNYRIEWPDPKVHAVLATGTEGGNNGVTWTAVHGGVAGNAIIVVLVNPGGTGAISVAVSAKTITVTLGRTSGTITTTGAQLITAIQASLAASALVTVAATGTSTGASAVVAVGSTHLAGGRGSRWVLAGIINNFGVDAKIDAALEASVTLKISGAPNIEGIS